MGTYAESEIAHPGVSPLLWQQQQQALPKAPKQLPRGPLNCQVMNAAFFSPQSPLKFRSYDYALRWKAAARTSRKRRATFNDIECGKLMPWDWEVLRLSLAFSPKACSCIDHYACSSVHLKMLSLMVDGIPQRFCQQCGRFHPLGDFDGSKRSCRGKLSEHNARRRKRMPDDAGGSDTAASGGSSPAAAGAFSGKRVIGTASGSSSLPNAMGTIAGRIGSPGSLNFISRLSGEQRLQLMGQMLASLAVGNSQRNTLQQQQQLALQLGLGQQMGHAPPWQPGGCSGPAPTGSAATVPGAGKVPSNVADVVMGGMSSTSTSLLGDQAMDAEQKELDEELGALLLAHDAKYKASPLPLADGASKEGAGGAASVGFPAGTPTATKPSLATFPEEHGMYASGPMGAMDQQGLGGLLSSTDSKDQQASKSPSIISLGGGCDTESLLKSLDPTVVASPHPSTDPGATTEAAVSSGGAFYRRMTDLGDGRLPPLNHLAAVGFEQPPPRGQQMTTNAGMSGLDIARMLVSGSNNPAPYRSEEVMVSHQELVTPCVTHTLRGIQTSRPGNSYRHIRCPLRLV